jgi:hypothetical protein
VLYGYGNAWAWWLIFGVMLVLMAAVVVGLASRRLDRPVSRIILAAAVAAVVMVILTLAHTTS